MVLFCRYDGAWPQQDLVGKAKNFEIFSEFYGQPMEKRGKGEM